MEDITVFCEDEALLPRVKERFTARGVAARYVSRAEDADDSPVVAVMPHCREASAKAAESLLERGFGVVVIVRAEHYAAVRARFGEAGGIVLKLPLDADLFVQAVGIAGGVGARLRRARDENETLKSKFDDLKLVDRAKCTLIQYLRMTESEAHRYIEKQAMNKRLPKREVALEILKIYES